MDWIFIPYSSEHGSLIALAILNCGGGRGGAGGDGGEGAETGGGVGGGGKCGIRCLIKLTMLLGETFVSSSSLSREGEIKGLASNSSLILFLYIYPLHVVPKINLLT